MWNPFRSKLAAAVLAGVDNVHIKPGAKVLYLGGASGTSVSHVSDVVGPEGTVYAVEFSHRSGRDLVNMAKKRPNVVPIIEDARHPQKYRMLVPMVDVVFADVAQPDQARIVGLNAQYFLKNSGFFVISIKASCIDSTAPPEAVFAREVKKLQEQQLKPKEQARGGGWECRDAPSAAAPRSLPACTPLQPPRLSEDLLHTAMRAPRALRCRKGVAREPSSMTLTGLSRCCTLGPVHRCPRADAGPTYPTAPLAPAGHA